MLLSLNIPTYKCLLHIVSITFVRPSCAIFTPLYATDLKFRRVAESVAASLEGQALGSFTRVSTAVRTAVEAALTRILTPKRSIDILREVRRRLLLPPTSA